MPLLGGHGNRRAGIRNGDLEVVLFILATSRGELVAADKLFVKLNGGTPMKFVELVGDKITQTLNGTDLGGTSHAAGLDASSAAS